MALWLICVLCSFVLVVLGKIDRVVMLVSDRSP